MTTHDTPQTEEGAVGAQLVIYYKRGPSLIEGLNRVLTWRAVMTVAGIGLLVGWGLWWSSSMQRDKLRAGRFMWFPPYTFLGIDFLHNYYAANHWLRGGDPYEGLFGAPIEAKYCYPPVVLPLFAWCGVVSPLAAVRIWMAALAVCAGVGALASWRTRQRLGLWDVPLPFVIGAVLCATPVVFAIERGNYDLLIVPLLVAGAWSLRRRSWAGDALAGCCVALACWLKIYPAMLLFGLLALGRYRALAFAVAAVVLVGVADLPHTLAFMHNVGELARNESPAAHGVVGHADHSVTGSWVLFWARTRLARLGAIPGPVVWAAVALPVALVLGLRIRRSPEPALLYPYFAWLTAAGTFLPGVSNDYNLVFLPLAALALWDRRDAVWVHGLMALTLLWWQPVRLTVGAELLFLFKVLGVLAVAACVASRTGAWARGAAENEEKRGAEPSLAA